MVSVAPLVRLGFVSVSRSVNEPEIGSVSVCIPTVCFVESKLIDANCLHMPYWLLWAWVQPRKKWGIQRWKPSVGGWTQTEFNPEKFVLRDERYQYGVETRTWGSSSTPKSEVQRWKASMGVQRWKPFLNLKCRSPIFWGLKFWTSWRTTRSSTPMHCLHVVGVEIVDTGL